MQTGTREQLLVLLVEDDADLAEVTQAALEHEGLQVAVAHDGLEALELIDKLRPQLEQYENFCKELGEQPADVALAWLLSNPVVTAPIIGPRTLEQFEGSLRSIDIELDADVLGRLDKIFPGPGGPAPEAYAW